MTRAQLIGTLSSLVELLQHCGHSDRAAWLQERKSLLEGLSATAAERDHARRELHQSLSGLDGLFDLRLKPHPRSPYTAKMANGLKNRFANQLGELTKPAPPQFAWHVDAVTPDQIGSAITDWFNQAGSAGLKLPDGWFGRPNDNQFRLTQATVADGIVVVALDDGGLLTVFTPVRVEATPSILRLSGSRYIEWRWIGFGSDDALTEVFESGDVEFVRSFAKG